MNPQSIHMGEKQMQPNKIHLIILALLATLTGCSSEENGSSSVADKVVSLDNADLPAVCADAGGLPRPNALDPGVFHCLCGDNYIREDAIRYNLKNLGMDQFRNLCGASKPSNITTRQGPTGQSDFQSMCTAAGGELKQIYSGQAVDCYCGGQYYSQGAVEHYATKYGSDYFRNRCQGSSQVRSGANPSNTTSSINQNPISAADQGVNFSSLQGNQILNGDDVLRDLQNAYLEFRDRNSSASLVALQRRFPENSDIEIKVTVHGTVSNFFMISKRLPNSAEPQGTIGFINHFSVDTSLPLAKVGRTYIIKGTVLAKVSIESGLCNLSVMFKSVTESN